MNGLLIFLLQHQAPPFIQNSKGSVQKLWFFHLNSQTPPNYIQSLSYVWKNSNFLFSFSIFLNFSQISKKLTSCFGRTIIIFFWYFFIHVFCFNFLLFKSCNHQSKYDINCRCRFWLTDCRRNFILILTNLPSIFIGKIFTLNVWKCNLFVGFIGKTMNLHCKDSMKNFHFYRDIFYHWFLLFISNRKA